MSADRLIRLPLGQDVLLALQFEANDGTLYVASEVTDWDLYVYDEQEGGSGVPIYSDTANAPGNGSSGAIKDTPVVDGAWDGQDDRGYNFTFTLDYSTMAAGLAAGASLRGGRRYRVRVELNTASEGPKHQDRILAFDTTPQVA